MATVFHGVQINNLLRGDGVDHRVSVRVATTSNVDLESNLTSAPIDGVSLVAGDRLLVKNQTAVSSVVDVTAVADVADSLAGRYFLVSKPGVQYYVWYKTGAGTIGTDPAIAGRTGVQVNIATGATAGAVATATAAILGAVPGFSVSALLAVVTITVAKSGEYANDGDTLFGFAVVTPGSGAVQHGIYYVVNSIGGSYRADDLIVNDDAKFVFCDCEEGTVNAKSSWTQINKPAIVDVDPLSWIQDSRFNYNQNDIFYANSSSTMASITPANNNVLVSGPSGVPSWSNYLPVNTNISGPFLTGDQIVNKDYVDGIAAGLDTKESVRVRTLGTPAVVPTISTGTNNIGGTYNPTGGPAGTGAFTGVDLTDVTKWDLGSGPIVLGVGDRVLVMNQTDAKQNGIYEVTVAGAMGALKRAHDQDGMDPTYTNPYPSEVSGGNFTFVEGSLGDNFRGTGWVVIWDGVLTINTDPMNWTQFSTAGQWNALQGISISGANISADIMTNGGIVFTTTSPAADGQMQVDLGASSISGIVSTSHGGTGSNLTAALNDLLVGTGSNTFTNYASVAKKVLTTDSAGTVGWRNDVHLDNIIAFSNEATFLNFSNMVATPASQNFIQVNNADAGSDPKLCVVGLSDATVDLSLQAKGSGAVNILGTTGTATSGELRLWSSTNGNFVSIQAPAVTVDQVYTWPLLDGTLANDVMVTDSNGVLSFVSANTLPTRSSHSLISAQVAANTTSLTAVGYFSWNFAEYGTPAAATLLFYANPNGKVLEVQVWNETLAAAASTTGSYSGAAGWKKLALTVIPTANALLSVRVRKTAGGGLNPNIFGVQLVLNPVDP